MIELVKTLIIIIIVLLFLFLWAWPISFPLLIYYIYKKNKNKKYFKSTVINKDRYQNNGFFNNIQDTYVDINDYKLEWFDTNDIDVLKRHFSSLFIDFERALNNLDYNTLYNICTPSLYELYHSDLTVNLKLGNKKIIDNISIEKMVIYNTTKNDEEQKVYIMLEMKSNSYTMNSSGKITSGSPMLPVKEEFIAVFVKKLKKANEGQLRCPNCGATVTSTKCEYCNTEFKQYEFKIDTIRKLV